MNTDLIRASLNKTRLQAKEPALYETISQILDGLNFLANQTLSLTQGGTSSNLSKTGGLHQVLQQTSVGAPITVGQLAEGDLSDYSTGTWVPVLGGTTGTSGQTYSLQNGFYIKIGKLVIADFTIQLSALGTVTGNSEITGLPFTSENVVNHRGSAYISFFSGLGATVIMMTGHILENTSAILLYGANAATTLEAQLGVAFLGNTTAIIGTAIYRAA